MRFILLVLLSLTFLKLAGQGIPQNPNHSDSSGRQGQWTILFDNDWSPGASESEAAYYRLITYKDDKPVGIGRDFWITGEIQLEFELVEDRPHEIYHGKVTSYLQNGVIDNLDFYQNGVLDIELTEKYILEGLGEDPENINLLGVAGNFYFDHMSQKEKATDYLSQYVKQTMKKHGNNSIRYALALQDLGWVYLRNLDYRNAEPLFLKAKDILDNFKETEILEYVGVLVYVGDMYRYMDRPILGLSYLNEALELYEKNESKMDFEKVILYSNMALCYELKGEYAKAIELMLLAKEGYTSIVPEESSEIALIYNNLAVVYSKAGLLDQAEKHFTRSLEINIKALGEDHLEYLLTLPHFADVLVQKGKYDEAASIFKKAYEGLAELTSQNDHLVISIKRSYALVRYLQGYQEEIYDVLRSTAQLNQEYISSYFDYLSEPARVAFYNGYVPFFNSHTTWIVNEHKNHPELLSDMLNMQLRNKALLLSTSNKIKNRIIESGDRKLIALYD